jgi:outer membrane lipoprotein SlyB
MKHLFVASILAAALAGCATAPTPYAPQDFHFSASELQRLPALASGMVESVRQVPRDIHAFQNVFEHRINPEVDEQLLIRLDDGRAVTVLDRDMQRFAPGQRVRIVAGGVARE